MSDSTLTRDSPLWRRLAAWASERFPLAQGVLILVMYAGSMLAGRALAAPEGAPLTLEWADPLGFLALWAFFLMLRVFDEHKDYELDLKNHPDRVLQSDLISLGHLKALGALAVATQLGASIAHDAGLGPATYTWLLVITWSSLMAAEFFIGEWLEQRLVLYAASHMVVMPMAVQWVAQMGAGDAFLHPAVSWPLLVVGFCAGAALEVTRKTRAPAEERDTVDSYARDLGIPGAVATILTFTAASSAAQSSLIHELGAPAWLHAAAWASPLLMGASLGAFWRDPTVSARKRNEAVVALTLLLGYAVLLAAVLTTRSLA